VVKARNYFGTKETRRRRYSDMRFTSILVVGNTTVALVNAELELSGPLW